VGKSSSFTVKHDLSWFRHYAKDIRGIENRFFILNSVFTNAVSSSKCNTQSLGIGVF